MNVAVGRLQLSIRVAPPARVRHPAVTPEPQNSLEHAFNADRNHRAVESDKQRWSTESILRNNLR